MQVATDVAQESDIVITATREQVAKAKADYEMAMRITAAMSGLGWTSDPTTHRDLFLTPVSTRVSTRSVSPHGVWKAGPATAGQTAMRYLDAAGSLGLKVVGPGTVYDRAFATPFYKGLDAISNSPFGDPGVGMAFEQAMAGGPPPVKAAGMLGVAQNLGARALQAWNSTAKAVRAPRVAITAESAAIIHSLDGAAATDVINMAAARGLQTPRDSLVLWSGLGSDGAVRAQAFAREFGGTTLEMTPGGRWLNDMDLYGPSSPFSRAEADMIWGEVSGQMVGQASGQVRSILGQVRPTSVYRSYEIPAMQQNPAILGLDPLQVRPMLKASGY